MAAAVTDMKKKGYGTVKCSETTALRHCQGPMVS